MLLMNRILLAFLISGCAAPAFCQAEGGGEDPVVVVLDGRPWRRKELEEMIQRLPPGVSQNFFIDRKNFLLQLALVQRLAGMAEKDGLDQQEPHRTRLEYQRNVYLAQAEMDHAANRIQVTQADAEKYFEQHRDDFSQARVRVIYLSFNDNPPAGAEKGGRRPRSGIEAEKLAKQVVEKARAGADFARLAQEYSEDEETRARGGEFRPVKPNDANLPPEIRTAIFSLKPGQVSDPVRQTGGFWIFRLENFVVPELKEVQNEVYQSVREERFREWIQGVQKGIQLEVKDASYFQGSLQRK